MESAGAFLETKALWTKNPATNNAAAAFDCRASQDWVVDSMSIVVKNLMPQVGPKLSWPVDFGTILASPGKHSQHEGK